MHNKTTMRKTLVLALSLLAVSPLYAGSPTNLTWQDCQDMALKGNPSLASYRDALDAARYNYNAAENSLYPSLTASHSLSMSGNNSTNPADTWYLGLSASETLFNMKTYASINAAQKSVEAANANLRQSAADSRTSLRNAYLNLLYAQEKVHLTERIYDIRQKNAETISLQYDSGSESKGDMMNAKALASSAKGDIAAAKRSLLTEQRELAANIGMDDFTALAVTGTLSMPAGSGSIEVDKAAENSPAVLVALKSVEAQEITVKTANYDLYPTLSATQGLGWSDDTEFPGSRSWSAGVSLSWALFGNGPTYHKNNLASARATLAKTKESYRNTLLSARQSMQSALASLDTALDTVETSELTLAAALQRDAEGQIQYLAGSLTYQNWEDVEQSLVSAEQSHLSALLNVNTARAQVEDLLGIPLGE